MGTAQNRQLLAEVEEIATSFEWEAQNVTRKRVKQTAQWVWNQLNEVWYFLFYAKVVRRVGPNEPEVVVRNSIDELRYRY
jgi:hypothetical protein